MPCTRADEDRTSARDEGDLRREGACNREILRHPHRGRPLSAR
ncbi:hypothetical protein [Streptomyces sp. NPDC051162]